MSLHTLPKKQKITLKNGKLEYITSGEGTPTLVLINGAGGPVEGWYKIYPALEAVSTVLAYNRPGIDGSDKPQSPQTGEAIITQLRDLLDALKLQPPYVLVGHSLGGLYANLFARRFPDEVAGVVFLEATAPGDEILQTHHQTWFQKLLSAPFALYDSISGKDPNKEMEWVAETVRQVHAAGTFPPVPVTVITGGKRPPALFMSQEAWQLRQANQQRLAQISPLTEQVILADSAHFPQFSEPERVVAAIQDILNRVKVS